MVKPKLIGPFKEIVTMRGLSPFGAISDDSLEVISNGGIVVDNGLIMKVGDYDFLHKNNPEIDHEFIAEPMVLMPGFVDAHTHICFEGSRANDYALRVSGKSYLEIAQSGGGILSTVNHTRQATETELVEGLTKRCNLQLSKGVTTCEVKSGYGLSLESELKMLRAISKVNSSHAIDLISTCLAAHTNSPDFDSIEDYSQYILKDILPAVKELNLSNRVDVFVEKSAFDYETARHYLQQAKRMGFEITVHADQFTAMGSVLAAELGALSADHLEASTEKEIDLLVKAQVCGVLLPGASMGLGMHYPKGRLMLDKGMCVAIASDWNPGSAPMGDLLLQAAVFGAFEKLSTTETLAAITYRAAKALNLFDRGVLTGGMRADLVAFPTSTHKDILYYQGAMKPAKVWVKGI